MTHTHAHAFRFQRNETNPRSESFQTVCNLANASMRLNAGRYRDFERSTTSPLEQGGTSASHEKREGRLGEFDERLEERGGGGGGGDHHEPRHGFSLASTAFDRPVCTFFLLRPLIAPPLPSPPLLIEYQTKCNYEWNSCFAGANNLPRRGTRTHTRAHTGAER